MRRPRSSVTASRLVPVSLSEDDISDFYDGFSNETLWPLYHDAIAPPRSTVWWEGYVRVNERFAEAAAAEAAEGAVWVHDYHLQLVPLFLRELRPDVRIGFFLHIPFPPQELFMRLPWRGRLRSACWPATSSGSSAGWRPRTSSPSPRRPGDQGPPCGCSRAAPSASGPSRSRSTWPSSTRSPGGPRRRALAEEVRVACSATPSPSCWAWTGSTTRRASTSGSRPTKRCSATAARSASHRHGAGRGAHA